MMNAMSMPFDEAKARLRESEDRFRGAFEFAAIGMALVAPDGRWLRVNRSMCRIVGYTPEELLATNFQAITHPDDLETDIGYIAQMLDGSLSHYDMEKRYFHKDGHILWILLSVSLVRDARGRPLYFVSQIQDITEQRQLTHELRRARADLQADVTDLRESYRRIRELAQRLETVREEERSSIAQELHEGIAQDLFAMKLNLDRLRPQATGRAGVTEVREELAVAVDRCMLDTRQIANKLRPSALAHLPVSVVLKEHARYFGNISGLTIRVIEIAPIPVLEEATALVLFRAAQEALTNVARHAHANAVDIILRFDVESITMDIIDDGIGIGDGALAKAGSLGLLGIRERIDAFDGLLIVRKNAEAGTTISVRIPRT
jgi:PAS domain S-box-containing protein